MTNIRSAADIATIVTEAIKIDKEIVSQLSSEDVNGNFTDIYDTIQTNDIAESFASEAESLAAAERVQRIVSTLIKEEDTKRIADNQDTIAVDTTRIADNQDTIASKTTSIDTSIDALKEAGDPRSTGDGIRTLQPYGEVGLSILYLLYIKQAQMIEDDYASQEDQLDSIERVREIITELRQTFGSGF